jgi:hypothetical protein
MNILKSLRKQYFAIFLYSLTLFVSCNQYDDSNVDATEFNKYNRVLNDQKIIEIGQTHNSNLENLFLSNPQNIEELTNTALELYSNKGLERVDLENYFGNVDKMNTGFLVNLIETNNVIFVNSALLSEKVREIKSLPTVDLLKEHEIQTRKELEGVDLDLYLVLSTVYQYSTEFWDSHISQNLNLERSVNSRRACDWREADGISASIGFLTLAAAFAAISAVGIATGGTGVIPTVTIVASLLRIGASSALASIYTFISCDK